MLGKFKLHTIEVPIFKAVIDSYISNDEFVSVNNVLREYNEIKEETHCGTHYVNMVDISKKMYERNVIEAIVDSDVILKNT